MTGQPQTTSKWHLSREVSISMIAGMVLQFGGFAWYASKLSAQVNENTKDITRLETQNEVRNSQAMQINDRVIRIEERLGNFGAVLERIDKRLEEYISRESSR